MHNSTSDRRGFALIATERTMERRAISITGDSLTLRQLVRFARNPRIRVIVPPEALGAARRSAEIVRFQRSGVAPHAAAHSSNGHGDHTRPMESARASESRSTDTLPADIVRGAMLLRLNALVLGYSGASVELIEALTAMLNAGVAPAIPAQVAVECGDRAGLEYVARLFGGQGSMIDSDLDALVSGASLSTAALALAVHDAERAVRSADVAVALGLEATAGRLDAFLPIANYVRPHRGQCATADHVQSLVMGSALIGDPASAPPLHLAFRRAPSTHGASRDLVRLARRIVVRELNAATHDKLAIDGEIFETANGNGCPVGSAAEAVTIAVEPLTQLSAERTRVLLSFVEESAPEAGGVEAPATSKNSSRSALASALRARAALDQLQRTLGLELIIAAHAVGRRRNDRSDASEREPRTCAACALIASSAAATLDELLIGANARRVRRLVQTGRLLGTPGALDEPVRRKRHLFPHLSSSTTP